jgi:hypothetical protein
MTPSRAQPVGISAEWYRVEYGRQVLSDRAGLRTTVGAVVAHNLAASSLASCVGPIEFMMRWRILSDILRADAVETRRGGGSVDDAALTVDVKRFAEFWGESERTVYRSLRRFRTAFPGEVDPGRVLWCVQEWDLTLGWNGLAEKPVYATRRAAPGPTEHGSSGRIRRGSQPVRDGELAGGRP